MKRSKNLSRYFGNLLLVVGFVGAAGASSALAQSTVPLQKIRDLVIYSDSAYFSAFPSVIRRPTGEFILAFRRAPDRRVFGEPQSNHVDPNSYLVGLRSDDGKNWTTVPELIYAHPFGGSQDPCLLQLSNGTILCTSYSWAFLRPSGIPNLKKPYFEAGGAFFLGGYLLRSLDGAKTWQGPFYPPHITPEINFSALGNPLPAYNRGALCEGRDGRIFWIVAATDKDIPKKTSNHLLISDDKGLTWRYASEVAKDDSVTFNEASVYETPKGDLVAFLRTAGFGDQACIARSSDGGKSFGKWQSMGFQGHPLQATRLPDNRVLLVYGYRHKPYGVRAKVLNAECTDYITAPEFVIREDGGNTDIGYPWAVMLDDGNVLVTYYYNQENGTRYIAGTILEFSQDM